MRKSRDEFISKWTGGLDVNEWRRKKECNSIKEYGE